jgi:ferric-dicitrate binding protein FerR (iron transport regulator)
VLATAEELAQVLAPGLEHPAKCTEAAEAMRLVAALTESLAEVELQGRMERNRLKEQLAQVQRRLVWRTGALEILLLGVAAIVTVMWLTNWWLR